MEDEKRGLAYDVSINVVANLIAAGLLGAGAWVVSPGHRELALGIFFSTFTVLGALFCIPAYWRREYINIGQLCLGFACFGSVTLAVLTQLSGKGTGGLDFWIIFVGGYALMGIAAFGMAFSDPGIKPAVTDMKRRWKKLRGTDSQS